MMPILKRPPRTFYYSAIAIALLLAAVALPFAHHYYVQRSLITEVEGYGGSVVMEPGGPTWLRSWLPRELTYCFDTPREIHLANTTVDDDWLANLRDYPSLEMLGLADTNVTDAGLVHLSDMPHLQVLWLSNTAVSDAGLPSLRGLPKLVLFYLDGTRVTETGIDTLRKRLSHVDIQW
ncbi:Leucine Rich repeats (2 copies) [Symmachiella dynata]|uniref:hypothetical protein n=1 Tax=Symmachiella dynata TaxID=2527995 RepID=UPI00118C5910|nr:hypothetical protein [Symmachiella dynata]QDT47383.1 Leucine Rich repeats (2 copies) [Symmachiella dynata]